MLKKHYSCLRNCPFYKIILKKYANFNFPKSMRTKYYLNWFCSIDKVLKYFKKQFILYLVSDKVMFFSTYYPLLRKFGWDTTIYLSHSFVVWHQICLASKSIMLNSAYGLVQHYWFRSSTYLMSNSEGCDKYIMIDKSSWY